LRALLSKSAAAEECARSRHQGTDSSRSSRSRGDASRGHAPTRRERATPWSATERVAPRSLAPTFLGFVAQSSPTRCSPFPPAADRPEQATKRTGAIGKVAGRRGQRHCEPNAGASMAESRVGACICETDSVERTKHRTATSRPARKQRVGGGEQNGQGDAYRCRHGEWGRTAGTKGQPAGAAVSMQGLQERPNEDRHRRDDRRIGREENGAARREETANITVVSTRGGIGKRPGCDRVLATDEKILQRLIDGLSEIPGHMSACDWTRGKTRLIHRGRGDDPQAAHGNGKDGATNGRNVRVGEVRQEGAEPVGGGHDTRPEEGDEVGLCRFECTQAPSRNVVAVIYGGTDVDRHDVGCALHAFER
jgi:hypothetical protein